jgi:hypothetical protein
MNKIPDLDKIKSYSAALASKLSNEYFSTHDQVIGEHLLSFSTHKQLNLIIIKRLYRSWLIEIENLKNPYFNYQAPEVQIALKDFTNVLSKHIAIQKNEFSILLKKSIKDLILLLLFPDAYIEKEYRELAYFAKLSDEKKYYKVYTNLFQDLLNAYQNNTQLIIQDFTKGYAFDHLKNDIEAAAALEQLNLLSRFDEKDFEVPINPLFAKLKNEEPAAEQLVPSNPAIASAAPIKEEITVPEKVDIPVEKEISKPVAASKPLESQTNLRFNENLKAGQDSTIADRLSKSKIDDMKSAIPLNLKFLFINLLFEGNADAYNESLTIIDQSSSAAQARQTIQSKYSALYHWNKHEEEAEEFFKLIERKFN